MKIPQDRAATARAVHFDRVAATRLDRSLTRKHQTEQLLAQIGLASPNPIERLIRHHRGKENTSTA
jgi:hypothetical protein